jgi:hypothetical protein
VFGCTPLPGPSPGLFMQLSILRLYLKKKPASTAITRAVTVGVLHEITSTCKDRIPIKK